MRKDSNHKDKISKLKSKNKERNKWSFKSLQKS